MYNRVRVALTGLLVTFLAIVLVSCGGGGGSGGSTGGGSGSSSSSSSSSASLTTLIHYKRLSGNYSGWGLHLWNTVGATASIAATTETTWSAPHAFDGVTSGWATASIPLVNANAALNLIVHKGDVKSPAADLSFTPSAYPTGAWIVQGTSQVFSTQAAADTALAALGTASNSLDLTGIARINTSSGLGSDWANGAQFMEIFVRSYKDSNGDGIGDLRGVINSLDYLQSLGVTGIWLMPIYKSSDHDHGYAVVDYRSIESDYGSMADFDELVQKAHAKGIGIILDYVMNHASSENPLFLDAVSAPTHSKRDWFLWSDTNPGWTAFAGQSWHEGETGFYYSIFSSSMPDFNLRNSDVVDYHKHNLRFWLNRGVDGFRFDAVGVLVENGASAWNIQPENHLLMKAMQDEIKSYTNRYMVCEAPDAPSAFAAATSCGGAFAFGHQGDIQSTAITGTLSSGLVNWFNGTTRAQQPLFLSNHDGFAGNRPYETLKGHSEGDYRVAAAIALLASDTPFSYYGEEIGMSNGALSGDAALRTPMSWTSHTTNAGFSTATPYRGLSANVSTHNAASEIAVMGSLYEHYRSLYTVRANHAVLRYGTLNLKSVSGAASFVFTRTLGGKTAVVIINLSTATQAINAPTGLGNTAFDALYPSAGGSLISTSGGSITVNVPAQSVAIYMTP